MMCDVEPVRDEHGRLMLVAGRAVTVRVPATSANLGPGYDSLGLALGYGDRLMVRTRQEPGVSVEINGEGSDTLPRDESHLVVKTMRRTWTDLGVSADVMDAVGLELIAENRIPHGRGQGSSAAAIVSAVFAAAGLLGLDTDRERDVLFQLAAHYEGHPDNVAPAVYGGYTMSFAEDAVDVSEPRTVDEASAAGEDSDAAVACGATLSPVAGGEFSTVAARAHAQLMPVVAVPERTLSTDAARSLLPAAVDHADAASDAGRAALLTYAITQDPRHLMRATRDWLHERYREEAMPESAQLVRAARAAGCAAVISGAGPTVLVLAHGEIHADAALKVLKEVTSGGGWDVFMPGLDERGVMVEVYRNA